MIIHCLSCGKTISTNMHKCPYCCSEISEDTLQMNGVDTRDRLKDKMVNLVFGYVKS